MHMIIIEKVNYNNKKIYFHKEYHQGLKKFKIKNRNFKLLNKDQIPDL